ncbi:MAG: DUF3084 domain-containing protein [Gloeomargaritaceae cyanobacterium C42_A2020_066]|nr:DUF3084 domain-containing protein [Gloeomargaritaceae cyanobacterium C42_A2020_066]
MAGYTLVIAILLLGGVIATLGDRIGSKVGKARLSLFKMRPKNTAVLVTVLTGGLISASTLGILLASDRQLRDGLFRLQQIQDELKDVQAQKGQARQELEQARGQLVAAQSQLTRTRQDLREAETKVTQIQAALSQAERNYQAAQAKLAAASQQSAALQSEVARLGQERTRLQTQLSQATAQVTQAQTQANTLRQQGQQLQRNITRLELTRGELEQEITKLRQGNVVIRREQVLATATVRAITNPTLAREAVDQTLQEANRVAGCLTNPGSLQPEACINNPNQASAGRPQLRVSAQEINQLVQTLANGRDYVVRILAAANYSTGEQQIGVVTDTFPNRLVFSEGTVVATVTVNLGSTDEPNVVNALDRLFLASNVRARQSGVLADPLTNKVGTFNQVTLLQFVEQLQTLSGAVQVQSVTKRPIYTAGPLEIELVAVRDGQVLLRSG